MQNIQLFYFLIGPLCLSAVFQILFKAPASTKEYEEHDPLNNDKCRVFHKTGASHDVVIDEINSVAYLASGAEESRLAWFPALGKFNDSLPRSSESLKIQKDGEYGEYEVDYDGASKDPYREDIFLFDLELETFVKTEIQNYPSQDLVIHGMALRTWVTGINTIYTINHQRSGSVVSIFEHRVAEGPVLKHIRDVKHKSIYTPSAIAPVTPTRFFVSNDHLFGEYGYLRLVEGYLQPWKSTNVVLCDLGEESDSCDYAIDWAPLVTGVEYVPDEYVAGALDPSSTAGTLFIAESSTGSVSVYRYNADGFLDNKTVKDLVDWNKTTSVGAPLSTVRRVSGTSDVLVTGIAEWYRGAMYLFSGPKYIDTDRNNVPVMAATLKKSEEYSFSHLKFYDKGEPEDFSYVTGMAWWKNKLLGGSVGREGLLVCDVDYQKA